MKVEQILKTNKKLSSEKKLVINLLLASSKAEAKMLKTLKPFKISAQQFNVLRILRGQHGKSTNLCEIQSRMVHKMSNTTRLVDKLIEKKLVERIVCEHNRRKVEINITKEGLKLLKTLDPLVENAERETVENLSAEEIEQLNSLLEKLRA